MVVSDGTYHSPPLSVGWVNRRISRPEARSNWGLVHPRVGVGSPKGGVGYNGRHNAYSHTVKLHLKTRKRVHLKTPPVSVLSPILDLRMMLHWRDQLDWGVYIQVVSLCK